MNDHPDLIALLRGELSNADVTGVGDHLGRCDECQHELADTAVGHALLTGTIRTLSRPARLELPEVPSLKSPTSSRRGRAWLRPLGLVAAAAALVAGTAVVSQWADRRLRVAPDRGGSRADRRPGAGRGHRIGPCGHDQAPRTNRVSMLTGHDEPLGQSTG